MGAEVKSVGTPFCQ